MSDLLPVEVRRTLAAEGSVRAGEQLVRLAETMARSQPGDARQWGLQLARSRFEDRVMDGCAKWAAGVAFYLAGDVERAAPVLRDAAAELQRSANDGLADRARLLLVDLHGERFEIDRARRLAAALHRRFSERGDRERAAVALVNLASAEDAVDRVARARDLWRTARGDLARGSMRRLLTDANLSIVASLEGRFDEAAAGLQAVADEARRQRLVGLALQAELNLAEVEFAAGRLDDAFARWHEVISAAEGDGNAPVGVAAKIDCAAAEAGIGDFRGARSRLAEVIERAESFGLSGESRRAKRLLIVADAAEGATGARSRALAELGGSAFGLQRDLLLVDLAQLDPTIAPGPLCRASRRLMRSGHQQRGKLGLAWAAHRYLARGNRHRARVVAAEALAGTASPWIRMIAHHVLGRTEGRGAIRHLSLAARSADGLHGRLAAAADRQAFLTIRGDVYLDLLSELLARNTPQDRKRALGIADRLRAGWLLDELARRTDRGDDELVQHWQELRRRLAGLLQELEGGEEPRVRRSGLRLHGVIRSLERELRQTETKLARRWPFTTSGDRRGAADDLLEALPGNEMFVEYLIDRENLLVFRAWAGRLTVANIAGGGAAVRDLLSSVHFHLESNIWLGDDCRPQHRAALDDRLRRLGELLLDPLPLDRVERLWISPHAGLFNVPWAALTTSSGRPLVDRVPFTIVPGAESAATLLGQTARRPNSVAIGGASAPNLPMVEREVGELSRMAGGSTVADATTRSEFMRLISTHEQVHLAGHAVFLDGLPLASGLKLADGYITVHDLAATRLAARFVSFGVCSGLRLSPEAGDRYAGFVLALMSGGVRTVVGPIASVRDDIAYAFDVTLHRMLGESGDPSAAFRGAVLAVRAIDPRPATWGSFHIYGDPRRWENA